MLNGFSKLVVVSFQSCCSTRVLPIFSQLPHLKFLDLQFLSALEFIEDYENNSDCHGDFANYFPSLASSQLNHMAELKGWSRADNGGIQSKQHRFFPCLSELCVKSCPKLKSMPSSPKLKRLLVNEINAKLLKFLPTSHDHHEEGSCLFSSAFSTSLKRLKIDNVSDQEDLTFASSQLVEYLKIRDCSSLRNISEGLKHLSKLQTLRILSCDELDLWDDNHTSEEDEDKTGQSSRIRTWQGLGALRSLYLYSISKLEALPCGIDYVPTLQSITTKDLVNLTPLPEQFGNLSQLQHLYIGNCPKLASLPQSFCNLSSLQQLNILNCPILEKRCQPPNGEDWPLIRHIPNL